VKPRRIWIVVLPVAALLVVGCGGDDESTESTAVPTTAPTALRKAELIEQGDAICAEVNAAVGAVGAGSTATSSSGGQAADLYSGMIDSLKNLGTPAETDGYAEFSTAADELATAEDEAKLASERGDTAGLEAAESNASSALTSFQNAASEYGFEDCSEGPSAPVTIAPSGEAGETEAGEALEEEAAPEAIEPEAEAEPAPEVAPETGGAGGTAEGGGTAGAPEGGGSGGGSSGGIGPG
jgi:uncharacterized membrane protein YgcG